MDRVLCHGRGLRRDVPVAQWDTLIGRHRLSYRRYHPRRVGDALAGQAKPRPDQAWPRAPRAMAGANLSGHGCRRERPAVIRMDHAIRGVAFILYLRPDSAV